MKAFLVVAYSQFEIVVFTVSSASLNAVSFSYKRPSKNREFLSSCTTRKLFEKFYISAGVL